MSSFLNIIGQLLTSKKFIALITGFVVTLLAKWKLNVDPTTVQYLIGLIIAYIVGQGISDSGKEAAKIEAVSASSLSNNVTPKADEAVKAMAEEVKAG
jgi:uncharacterized membrane protein (DUF441 family)